MSDATEREEFEHWWNEEEHRFLNLVAEAESADITSEEERLNRAAVLETVRRKMREIKGRVAALAAQAETSGDA